MITSKKIIIYVALICVCIISNATDKEVDRTYLNSKLPLEDRVKNLLSQMTLEEKIQQMCMLSLQKLEVNKRGKVTKESLENLFNGHSIGCLESPFISVDQIALYSEAADQYLRTKTRLGIPGIQIAECLHGQLAFGATIFPQAIAQGSTWNTELIRRMSETIAAEASLSGVDQALSPLFDLARDPRYGRVEECYGEDPYHVAEMGKAFVIGMQGVPETTKVAIPEGNLICTAKHFVAYSTPLAGINLGPNVVGPRDLRTLHLYPFEKVVRDANVYSVMPSYNELNGIPLHADKYLIKEVLRGEYGFNGYIFSDYGAVNMLESFHKTTANKKETAKAALKAGIDLEAPQPYAYSELKEMVENGEISIHLINEAVANILTVKFKAGLFDREYKVPGKVSEMIHTNESKKLARQIAEEAIVLLKNDKQLLPFNAEKLKSIAVIGPNADRVQYGDYSCTKDKESGVTVLEGIRNLVGNQLKINYAEGCDITKIDKSGFDKAVEAAKASDAVVLVVGGTSMPLSGIGWGEKQADDYPTCGEGFDRTDLAPPGVQPELIKAIHATGKPVVMVMVHGRAYSIPWEKEHIPAILDAWYPGEEGGTAVANILFGEVNPSGKLTVSYPRSAGHVPVVYNHKPSGRGFYNQRGTKEEPARDYVFSSPDPVFPFGHGLSYTSFEYSNLQIENNNIGKDETVRLSLTVKNTGKKEGKEVVQLYVNDKVSSVSTPVKMLKGFEKINLKPQEEAEIKFEIPFDELGLWDRQMKYVVEPGEFDIMIGSSCEDIRLKGKINHKK